MENKMSSEQAYYIPESSKLPFAMALTMLTLIIGAANTVNNMGTDSNFYLVLLTGFAMMWTTMFIWFRQTIKENHAGLNNSMLSESYVFGMAWFIFSEVMFFFAFFFALAYIRNFAVPWLGGEGEKGLANMLWTGWHGCRRVVDTSRRSSSTSAHRSTRASRCSSATCYQPTSSSRS